MCVHVLVHVYTWCYVQNYLTMGQSGEKLIAQIHVYCTLPHNACKPHNTHAHPHVCTCVYTGGVNWCVCVVCVLCVCVVCVCCVCVVVLVCGGVCVCVCVTAMK